MRDNSAVIDILQDTIKSHREDITDALGKIKKLAIQIEVRTASIAKEQEKINKLIKEDTHEGV